MDYFKKDKGLFILFLWAKTMYSSRNVIFLPPVWMKVSIRFTVSSKSISTEIVTKSSGCCLICYLQSTRCGRAYKTNYYLMEFLTNVRDTISSDPTTDRSVCIITLKQYDYAYGYGHLAVFGEFYIFFFLSFTNIHTC